MRTGMKMNLIMIKELSTVLCLIDHHKCAGMTCTVNTCLIGFVKLKKVRLLHHLIGVISTIQKEIIWISANLKKYIGNFSL